MATTQAVIVKLNWSDIKTTWAHPCELCGRWIAMGDKHKCPEVIIDGILRDPFKLLESETKQE